MTEKKTTRKTTSTRRRAKTVPSTELKGSESALLDALRSNMSLLGELAARYEVSIRPDGRKTRPQSAPRTTSTACSGRRCPPWPRSSCVCCCSTTRTRCWVSGWSTKAT